MQCPRCSSQKIIKNGSIANGKKKFMCKDCSRQFVENPKIKIISKETWEIVDRLLVEKISQAGISRALGISKRWLRKYIKEKRNEVPKKPFKMSTNKKIHIEFDELWTYSGNKENDLWLWIAVERKTRLIVGAHLGKRDIEGAQGLWNSLSDDCREHGIFYTDHLSAYSAVFPAKQHKPVDKKSGKTSHIERLNLTFRQRVAALVRKSLSFSRNVENLAASIWRFIHSYNEYVMLH